MEATTVLSNSKTVSPAVDERRVRLVLSAREAAQLLEDRRVAVSLATLAIIRRFSALRSSSTCSVDVRLGADL